MGLEIRGNLLVDGNARLVLLVEVYCDLRVVVREIETEGREEEEEKRKK